MWMYHDYFPPEPPQRPAALSTPVEQLSADLMKAIQKDDLTEARRIFDLAFWEKSDFRPGGYHLLQAVRHGRREMTQLLATHGAKWSTEEAKVAKHLTPPEKWAGLESVLKNAGIRTAFNETEMKSLDLVTVARWTRQNVEEAERMQTPDAAALRARVESLAVTAVVEAALQGDMNTAVSLLLLRLGKGLGDGTPESPFDVSREFNEIALTRLPRAKLALKFLDDLKAAGCTVKPLAISNTLLWLSPVLVPELEARGLLSDAQKNNRLEVLNNWTALEDSSNRSDHTFKPDTKLVDDLRCTAGILFSQSAPVTPAEAETFVSMHERRAEKTPYALTRVEKELLAQGFFDSPAFTAAHFKRMADSAPKGQDFRQEKLAEEFNRRAFARAIAEQGLEKFFTPSKFGIIEEAHKNGGYRANARETALIVDYLFRQVKKDIVPDSVVAAVKALKDGGADFSKVNPNGYLGKKAPGLAKTLLDAGAVTAQSLDIEALTRRNGNELRPLTPPTSKDYAEQEFMCQIILERLAPGKYIPLRQKGESYQPHFIREYIVNKAFKRRVMPKHPKGPQRTRGTGPR